MAEAKISDPPRSRLVIEQKTNGSLAAATSATGSAVTDRAMLAGPLTNAAPYQPSAMDEPQLD